jgi:hypothetical protein
LDRGLDAADELVELNREDRTASVTNDRRRTDDTMINRVTIDPG